MSGPGVSAVAAPWPFVLRPSIERSVASPQWERMPILMIGRLTPGDYWSTRARPPSSAHHRSRALLNLGPVRSVKSAQCGPSVLWPPGPCSSCTEPKIRSFRCSTPRYSPKPMAQRICGSLMVADTNCVMTRELLLCCWAGWIVSGREGQPRRHRWRRRELPLQQTRRR